MRYACEQYSVSRIRKLVSYSFQLIKIENMRKSTTIHCIGLPARCDQTNIHTHMLPGFLHWRWLNMCRASGLNFECSSFFCKHCKFAERMLRSSVTIHWKRTMSRNTNIFFMFQHFFLYRSIAFALITFLIDRIKVMKIFIDSVDTGKRANVEHMPWMGQKTRYLWSADDSNKNSKRLGANL